MPLRAIIVGNAQPFSDALVALVLELEDSLELVGWAHHQSQAVQLALSASPDLVLVSSQTPPFDGIEATRAILIANPSCRVIILGQDNSATEVERAWSAGASGYVTLDPFSIDLLAFTLKAEETRLSTHASFLPVALP